MRSFVFMQAWFFNTFSVCLIVAFGCSANVQPRTIFCDMPDKEINEIQNDTAVFGAGCFWCVEAVFQEVAGVLSVTSGYMGGHVKNPTYKEICTGETGHAEVTRIVFDPKKVSFAELLEVFWKTHDPTTLNRQGADIGTQYRSVIFYISEEQKKEAEAYKIKLNTAGVWDKPIVTEITAVETFYEAEDYHQNYYRQNPDAAYCQFVVRPKLDKFRAVFADKVKK